MDLARIVEDGATAPGSSFAPAGLLGRWVRRRLAIAPDEVSFARRGFHPGAARPHLEAIGRVVLDGYHAALEERDVAVIAARLGSGSPATAGFAHEGAAMALGLLDAFALRRGRWAAWERGAGRPHVYMVHVGLGLALARLRRRVAPVARALDPLHRWLLLDGYGFHEGFFRGAMLRPEAAPAARQRFRGYERRAFDQGLGRSLWFVECGAPDRIAERLAATAVERRGDVWSGVGLACAYAGGAGPDGVAALVASAGADARAFAQGVAFAAEARRRAGNPVEHTEEACRAVWRASLEDVAGIARRAREDLPPDADAPAYEIWRRRIQDAFGGAA